MVIWQAILIVAVVYSILIFLFYKFVYAASIEQSKHLKKLAEEGDHKLQEITEEKKKTHAEIKRLFEEAEKEIARIKAQAHKENEKMGEDLQERAHHESERIIQQALSAKESIQKEIEKTVYQKCFSVADQVLHEVLSVSDLEALHQNLLQETVKEISGLNASKFEHLTAEGTLGTPYTLSQEAVRDMMAVLSKKAGRSVHLKQEVDKKLIAGIRIQIGSFSIDGSLSQRIQDAIQQRSLENP